MVNKEVKYHEWKGVVTAKKLLESYKENIIVYFDPDVDGMVSGYLVCKYLSLNGKSFQWFVNKDRKHDWSIPIEKVSGCNVVAVDFMIPEGIVEDLVKSGCNIVSMDHHINQADFIDVCHGESRGIVINNQYPFEEEDGRFLSGAGVVFETLRLLDSRMDTVENRALVGLTLLSDVCDIENSIARGYLYDLYNHKMKGFIGYLIKNTLGEIDYGFGVPRMDRKYVDYTFSPAINSALRFNAQDDIVEFFLGSGKLDLGYHKRQKVLVKAMQDIAVVKEFPNLRVVYIRDWELDSSEDLSVIPNFIGLLASRFLDGEKSVIAYNIYRDSSGMHLGRASFRGNINGIDYLSLLNTLLVGVGHPSAFGILDMKPSKALFIQASELCKKAEGLSSNKKSIAEAFNLSLFVKRNGDSFAEYNMYCLAQNSKYIRYKGKNIKVLREGAAFRKYIVDGIEITSFNLSLDFDSGLIYPIMERGYVYYYLQDGN